LPKLGPSCLQPQFRPVLGWTERLNTPKSQCAALRIMDALLLLIASESSVRSIQASGSFTFAADGQITSPRSLIYTGAQIVQPNALSDCADATFSIRWLWQRAAQNGRLYGCLYGGKWADVGTPEGCRNCRADGGSISECFLNPTRPASLPCRPVSDFPRRA